MAKKNGSRFTDAKEPKSRAFAMMSHTVAKVWANSCTPRSRPIESALSAKSGPEVLSKAEIRQEKARSAAEKLTLRGKAKPSETRCSDPPKAQLERCPLCGRPVKETRLRKHLVKCGSRPKPFAGEFVFDRGLKASQGGLPTLGKH